MGYECKLCKSVVSSKTGLLKHYRLHHGHARERLPCIHSECFCSFKTWGSLRSHLSRNHSQESHERVRSEQSLSFTCPCCTTSAISTERELFEHLGRHLKKNETVTCVFKDCNFRTNIYGTFASHRNRKHNLHSLQDFKEDLLRRYASSSNSGNMSDLDVQDMELSITDDGHDDDVRDLPHLIERKMALLFLKLESTFNVSQRCINEVVDELHFISHSASGPIIKDILQSCLSKHNCQIDETVVSDMARELCDANPFTSILKSGGPLSSAFKRRSYFKEHFAVVEPVEYVLSTEGNRSFQYVPILKSLLQALTQQEILDWIVHDGKARSNNDTEYRAMSDGIYYKTNKLFSGEEQNTVEARREAAIRCLIIYLGEKEEDLFKEFNDTNEFEANRETLLMKIAITGVHTLGSDNRNIPRCAALLVGIIYSLNLSYPKELKYTFEVFQKLFLNLDALKASAKVMGLKNNIF